MKDGCKACAFFEDHQAAAAAGDGLCRFNPPATQPGADKRALWPQVSADDWCSRFEAQAA
ncbi:MAG: hypothetical protein AAF393_04400 [Pseudomonadota bacterium]